MEFNRTKTNIKSLLNAPEEDRHKAAPRLIIVVGIIVIAIWLFILLPLQIFAVNFFSDQGSADEPEPINKQAATNELDSLLGN